jgi:hypothetical protein
VVVHRPGVFVEQFRERPPGRPPEAGAHIQLHIHYLSARAAGFPVVTRSFQALVIFRGPFIVVGDFARH